MVDRPERRLDGRVVVLTGASSGLGAHFATALAAAGAIVVLGARRADQLDAVLATVIAAGGTGAALPTDVRDPDQCRALAELAAQRFGRLDGLVNNAGITHTIPASRETPEQYRSVLEVNLFGTYYMAQACAARMAGGGSIVNVGSILGSMTMGLPLAGYSSSKAAVEGLTRDLAAQWTRRRGIRVNALVPGFIETDMTAEFPAGGLAWIADRLPMGRMGRAEELVGALLFLLGPESSYVTGSSLVVDGGALIV
jgi:NAD(P)-dependent dehydrogenase (short-subunit alcohol dehydrogenase family)